MNELSSLNKTLPPKYMERFDMCNDIIKELEIKCIFFIYYLDSRLQENQQKRLVPKFDDDENKKLDKDISSLIMEMTNRLKNCEDNIKQMISESTESELEEQIKLNMKQSIFSKLSEFTKKFKLNQEIYMKKYRELVGEDLIETNESNSTKENSKKNNFFLQEEGNDILKKRDNELNVLLSSVNELAQIFKELQVLIMEQGTILDRIDYNIENAVTSVKEGHKNLVKADEAMKKNCAKKAIMIMMIVDVILLLLLIFKLFI